MVYHGACSTHSGRECMFCCYWVCSVNVSQVRLDFTVVQGLFNSGFLSTFPNTCWERKVEIPNFNCGFVYFSFQLYLVLLHILLRSLLGAYTIRAVCPLDKLSFFIIINFLFTFSKDVFLLAKSSLIFSHFNFLMICVCVVHFTFNLSAPLYLKCTSSMYYTRDLQTTA